MIDDDGEKASLWTPLYVFDEERYKKIAGNASKEAKQFLSTVLYRFMGCGRGFADAIGGRLNIMEINIRKKTEEPEKLESVVICEIDVKEDMLNGGGNVHGGCSAYLVDICATMPVLALGLESGRSPTLVVSQVMNIVYHSPARVGDRLRIVSTTISLGARAMSARCEIWNATHRRLAVSGVLIEMNPSPPKL